MFFTILYNSVFFLLYMFISVQLCQPCIYEISIIINNDPVHYISICRQQNFYPMLIYKTVLFINIFPVNFLNLLTLKPVVFPLRWTFSVRVRIDIFQKWPSFRHPGLQQRRSRRSLQTSGMFESYARVLCSSPMFEAYVRVLCSSPFLFRTEIMKVQQLQKFVLHVLSVQI